MPASQIDVLTDLPSSPSEGNLLNFYSRIYSGTNYITNSHYQDIPEYQTGGEEEDSQNTTIRTSSIIQVSVC